VRICYELNVLEMNIWMLDAIWVLIMGEVGDQQ